MNMQKYSQIYQQNIDEIGKKKRIAGNKNGSKKVDYFQLNPTFDCKCLL